MIIGQVVPHKFEEISSIYFENNPTSMWIYDLETLCFLAVNNAAIHSYGYSRKEFLKMTLKDIRPSEDIPRLTDNISNVTEGLDVAGTWRHKKKDGSNIDVEIISHTINFAGRDAEMVLAHDITKRKQVEDELRTLNRITQLEDRVKERTAELTEVNKMLVHQINERTAVEIQLKRSLEEKVVLLKEVHHRVKNNLQIISSLLCLQSEYIKDKKIVEVFLETQNRVMSMATIHELLYQSDDVASIELGNYIHNLVNELFNSYEAVSNDISLEINVEDISLDLDKAIPCGLIINEITSNCLKHAFPAGKKGEIVISVHSGKKTNIELIVSDNGIGLPKDIDIQNPETLGLELISTLTEQLGGKLEVDIKNGTKFKLTFKLK
jgi:PAS domain S-box-containing protein